MAMGAAEMRKLLRKLLDEGIFVVTGHARKEMSKDDLCDTDAVNVLRGGVVREAEFENGAWRYQVSTANMTFVIEVDPEPVQAKAEDVDVTGAELVVVTAWRARR